MNEPRKATDVLLDIEVKLDNLTNLVRSQDLLIKVLSNKLNEVMVALDKPQSPKYVVEAPNFGTPAMPGPVSPPLNNLTDPERNIPIAANGNLLQTNSPVGFRRNSRPETYTNVKPEILEKPQNEDNMAVVPNQALKPAKKVPMQVNKDLPPQNEQSLPQNQVPVVQRCVDKNGKSIFLANVEITDLDNNQNVVKTRTNATGKWMASLAVGSYRVSIRKLESITKQKIEATQDIHIDGNKSKIELPMIIIK